MKKKGCPVGMHLYEGVCTPLWGRTSNIGKIETMIRRLRHQRDRERKEAIYNAYDAAIDTLENVSNMLKERKYGK